MDNLTTDLLIGRNCLHLVKQCFLLNLILVVVSSSAIKWFLLAAIMFVYILGKVLLHIVSVNVEKFVSKEVLDEQGCVKALKQRAKELGGQLEQTIDVEEYGKLLLTPEYKYADNITVHTIDFVGYDYMKKILVCNIAISYVRPRVTWWTMLTNTVSDDTTTLIVGSPIEIQIDDELLTLLNNLYDNTIAQ